MPYYEIVFENGDFSLVNAESDEAVVEAAKIQHDRAKSGLPNGPAGDRAERVVHIYPYGDNDPADVPRHVSKDVAKKRLADVMSTFTDDNGVVDLVEVANAVELRPLVHSDPHESNFAADATGADLWVGDN